MAKFGVGPWWAVGLNLLSLAFGIAACYVSSTYTNCRIGAYSCDHTEECPVLDGQIVTWLFAASVALLGLGALGMLVFGVVPTCMKNPCADDAACCRDFFMGAFGKILYGAVCIIALGISLNLLRILVLAYPEAQSDRPGDATRKYCNVVVLGMAASVAGFVFVAATIVLGIGLLACWRRIRIKKEQPKEKPQTKKSPSKNSPTKKNPPKTKG